MTWKSTEVRLIARPTGEPVPADFEQIEIELPDPGPGQVLIRNEWMSVDPYMRGRMDDVESYIPAFKLGEAMTGTATGTVVESNAPDLPVGTSVRHFAGWRTHVVLDAKAAEPIDTTAVPAEVYLGVLGVTGLTAYQSLVAIAPVKEGDTVWISGAAGAVGTAAGPIAKALGAAKVIGSAGGPAKTRRLVEEFGYDHAVDYRAGDLEGKLRAVAPEGIDVYLDNVGGDHLSAALALLKVHGRVAIVGAISQYNAEGPSTGPANFDQVIRKRLTLRGMNVQDHTDLAPDYGRLAARLLGEGKLKQEQTVVEGIDNAIEAFGSMMRGANTGKMLVKLV
ncbi:NADP-dependent oxidoreductase [Glycomyces buryatensis]|uniref:NADP-dependent oxidoreductase n=1 Tax=Glycomyces buryatensis TaxID=2570927 RepID=A0A4S8PZD4_9ACTN|nr:NADP-dependent oxidoreductase [Glycomyces buryatensis]THV33619.1 NADP-dependent oxidoreductase [Glycomyces buryatensis]